MATFEQHVNIAVIVTGITIAPIYASGVISTSEAFILLTLGLIGGILPDLDSDTSKAVQIAFKIMSTFLPLLLLLSTSETLPLVDMIVIWLISGVILQIIFTKLFLNFTTHRGIFHTIPMGILFGLLIISLFENYLAYNLYFSTLAGIFLFLGFNIHLLLDEFISLNAFGMKVKKSLGTAFKLYDKNNIVGTIILYILTAVLFILIDIDEKVFTDLYDLSKVIKLF